MTPEQRLDELGLDLPVFRPPVANFLSWRQSGDLLFLSGQGPKNPDGSLRTGKVGAGYGVPAASADARQVGLQIVATLRHALGSLDRVEAIIKLLGMVNATADFEDHPAVIDGCSDLLIEVFGDRGRHARSAVGMSSLPGGMTVEVEAIVRITPGYDVPASEERK